MSTINEIVIESIELKTIPVKLAGKSFKLVELTGAQRDEHLNRVGKRIQYNADGKALGFANYDDHQSHLISQCLRDENDKPVDIAIIRKWSASTQERLYNAVLVLSGLDKGEPAAKHEAKND